MHNTSPTFTGRMNFIASMAMVATRPSARVPPTIPPAMSIWLSTQPPKISPLTFTSAGIAKVRNSGLAWGEGAILRNYIAFDCVRKIQLGSMHSPVGAWLVQYAWPFPIIGAASLVLELTDVSQ